MVYRCHILLIPYFFNVVNLLCVFDSKTIQSYSEQLSELDQTIRRMIVESLGVEKYMDEHMNSTSYLLRVMKYKGPQSSETKVGLNAHTDKNIVTILYQNEVSGLEVLTKDGKWINVDPTPDTFTVMIGDSLYVSSFNINLLVNLKLVIDISRLRDFNRTLSF